MIGRSIYHCVSFCYRFSSITAFHFDNPYWGRDYERVDYYCTLDTALVWPLSCDYAEDQTAPHPPISFQRVVVV